MLPVKLSDYIAIILHMPRPIKLRESRFRDHVSIHALQTAAGARGTLEELACRHEIVAIFQRTRGYAIITWICRRCGRLVDFDLGFHETESRSLNDKDVRG